MKKRICYICSFIILFMIFLLSNKVYATEEIFTEEVNDLNFYEKHEQLFYMPMLMSETKYDKNEIIEYIVEESKKNVSEAKQYLNTDGTTSNPRNFYDISKYGVPMSDAYTLILAIFERPEMFYVTTVGYEYNAEGYATRIYVEYYMNQNEINSDFTVIENAVNKYLKGINSKWNDLEKIIYTNNYVCSLVQYNYDAYYNEVNATDDTKINYRVHKLNGGLVDNSPVCDGYSRTLNYLLSKVNIESSIVTSYDMCHAWSMVKLNNNYYHLDVTWNDSDNYGKNSYEYFLISNEEIENRKHYNYYVWELADDNSYDNHDMVWNKTVNYLTYNNGYWYYLDNYSGNINTNSPVTEIKLNKFDIKNNKLISTKNIDIESFVDEIYFAPGLTQKDNLLYFSTNTKFYCMSTDGTSIRMVYNPKLKDNQYLYSIEYKDNAFYYNIVEMDSTLTNGYKILSNSFIPVEEIKLNRQGLNIFINEPQKLTATILPTNNTDNVTISWKSSNEDIAKVDSNGIVTGLKKGSVNITATWNGITAKCDIQVIDKLPFPDVSTTAWYYEPIKFNYVNRMILGFENGTFSPNSNLTRGMIVTILHRIEGEPLAKSSENPFIDVNSKAYYYEAIRWAEENGIVHGYEKEKKFKPNNNIIRQDLACILSNYAEYKNQYVASNISLNKFSDYKDVSGYALDRVKWAVDNSIIRGKSGKIAPKDTTTRAEAAAMISNYFEAFK